MSPHESARKRQRVFVGRGFSHDIISAIEDRLQPLKYTFCISRSDAMRPDHANH